MRERDSTGRHRDPLVYRLRDFDIRYGFVEFATSWQSKSAELRSWSQFSFSRGRRKSLSWGGRGIVWRTRRGIIGRMASYTSQLHLCRTGRRPLFAQSLTILTGMRLGCASYVWRTMGAQKQVLARVLAIVEQKAVMRGGARWSG